MEDADLIEPLPEVDLIALCQQLQKQNVHPTHFLFVSLTLSPILSAATTVAAEKHFFTALSERAFVMGISGEPTIAVKWNGLPQPDTCLFWTVSRLAAIYVSQLTKKGLQKLCQETQEAFNLQDDDLVCNSVMLKATGDLTHLGSAPCAKPA